MKIKKLIFFLIIIIMLISFFIIFFNKTAKKSKIGNNSSSQEIVEYILNISSYELKAEVEIKSNKNTNKYVIKQNYNKDGVSSQEVLEPSNIAGVKIIKENNTLKIENSKLNLETVYNDYNYLSDNVLDLSSFIENYKKSEKSEFVEENDMIKLKVKTDELNEELVIDKADATPKKMKIKDNSKKSEIYILYSEAIIKK